MLVGNHDSYLKDNHNINLLEIFKTNINVIEKYKSVDSQKDIRLHFIPYLKEESIIELLKTIEYGKGRNYLFGHFGVNGFNMQVDGYTDIYNSVTKKILNKFDKVILGHFHNRKDNHLPTQLGHL